MRFRRSAWVKMIAQVQTLASSRPSMTIFTTDVGLQEQGQRRHQVGGGGRIRALIPSLIDCSNRSTHSRGWRFGRPSGVEEGGGDPRIGQ